MRTVLNDFPYSVRTLWKSPGFLMIAVAGPIPGAKVSAAMTV